MADSRDNRGKPSSSWPIHAPATPDREESTREPEPPAARDRGAGRIVHDERGNAVWNWVKETGRVCIDSTSALLKKLDFGDLKIEGQKDEELRIDDQAARDEGGGYDPYNQKTPLRKSKPPGKK
jgi:hypothetical protein